MNALSCKLAIFLTCYALAFPFWKVNATPPAVGHARYISDVGSDHIIVFVHGLNGDADGTWTNPNGAYWPAMISKDPAFAGTDVYVASFPTPKHGNNMTVNDLITYLADEFEADKVFSRHSQVIFVTHSLGGIIVQQLLVTYRDKNFSSKVPFIYMYGTPQVGSDLANVGRVFNHDPLINELRHSDGNFLLPALDNSWLHAGFTMTKRYCAYETQKMKGFKVVPRESATRGCLDQVAIDANHAGIVKPADTGARSYTALRNKFADLVSTGTRADQPSAVPAAQQYCPNGICINGPNSGSPTINNYGPLPRRILKTSGEAAISYLKNHPQKSKFEVVFVHASSGGEIDSFYRQVAYILEHANYDYDPIQVQDFGYGYKLNDGTYGVLNGDGFTCVHKLIDSDYAAIEKALQLAGYPCRDLVDSDASKLRLIIGPNIQ